MKELRKITSATLEEVFKSPQTSKPAIVAKGYKEIEEFFCDKSGWGAEDEPALTPKQLISQLKELVNKHGEVYTAITGEGQFQVYITVFEKSTASRAERLKEAHLVASKKIANNTYEAQHESGERLIILHGTIVCNFRPTGNVILNSGGWQTKTTKDRINKALADSNLPFSVGQYQKAWYIVKDSDGLKPLSAILKNSVKFSDGIILDKQGNEVLQEVTL